ncbi:MAG: hypothetical protein IKO68_13560 [Oscillospiraceae bacterium]|nr:hypothetical protein [Oscillospiraceae bacterium]
MVEWETYEPLKKALLLCCKKAYRLLGADALSHDLAFVLNQDIYYPSEDFLAKLKNAEWLFSIIFDEFSILCEEFDVYRSIKTASFLNSQEYFFIISRIAGRIEAELDVYLLGLNIDIINAISVEGYETKSIQLGKIIIVPDIQSLIPLYPNSALLLQNQRVEFCVENVHLIRKLLNTTKNNCLALCKDASNETFWTEAIMPDEAMNYVPSIVFRGYAEWHFCLPFTTGVNWDSKEEINDGWIVRHSRLKCKNMNFYFPPVNFEAAEINYLRQQLNGLPLNIDSCIEIVNKIVSIARQSRIGMLVFVSTNKTIEAITTHLCVNHNWGFKFVEPLPLGFNGEKDLLKASDTIPQYASVDGALLIDDSGRCHAFGVIVDGLATLSGDLARGSRYNTGTNFVHYWSNTHPSESPIIAIIASDDGIVNCECSVVDLQGFI